MNKSVLFAVRITPREQEAINNIAEIEGLKKPETFRTLIREGLATRGLPPVGAISKNEQLQKAN